MLYFNGGSLKNLNGTTNLVGDGAIFSSIVPKDRTLYNVELTGDWIYNQAEQTQADWEQTDDTAPDYIKNKPEITDFVDRQYNPSEYSGLGRVYLQKNIVNVGGTDKNILTQDAFNKDGAGSTRVPNTNTVFVVPFDFEIGTRRTISVAVPSANISALVSPEYIAAQTVLEELGETRTLGELEVAKAAKEIEKQELIDGGAPKAEIDAVQSEINELHALIGYKSTPHYYFYGQVTIPAHKVLHASCPGCCFLGSSSSTTILSENVYYNDSDNEVTIYIAYIHPELEQNYYKFIEDSLISIPDNSLLEFDGGSISCGTIKGNHTGIIASPDVEIFKDNVIIQGLWDITDVYDEWFKYVYTENTANNQIIKNILGLTHDNYGSNVHIRRDTTYLVELPTVPLVMKGGIDQSCNQYAKGLTRTGAMADIIGNVWNTGDRYEATSIFSLSSNTRYIIDSTIKMLPTADNYYQLFRILYKENITIEGNGKLIGDNDGLNKAHIFYPPSGYGAPYGEWGFIIRAIATKNLIIKDITLIGSYGDNLYITGDNRDRKTGLYYPDVEIKKFKSTAFIRINDDTITSLSAPSGGTYNSPIPNSTVLDSDTYRTWSDGIPSGQGHLWASSRVFGIYGISQDSYWEKPREMTNTDTYNVRFSDVVNNPGTPSANPLNWFNPDTDVSTDFTQMLWRAERTRTNSSAEWSDWTIEQIKGEHGESTFITPSRNVTLKNLRILYARRNGIAISCMDAIVEGCFFEGNGIPDVGGTAPKAGIDFECDQGSSSLHSGPGAFILCNRNVMMADCVFRNNEYDISSTANRAYGEDTVETYIKNCAFTSPLRLNKTAGLQFEDCYIPLVAGKGDSIWYLAASENINFFHCIFEDSNIRMMSYTSSDDRYSTVDSIKFVDCIYFNDFKIEDHAYVYSKADQMAYLRCKLPGTNSDYFLQMTVTFAGKIKSPSQNSGIVIMEYAFRITSSGCRMLKMRVNTARGSAFDFIADDNPYLPKIGERVIDGYRYLFISNPNFSYYSVGVDYCFNCCKLTNSTSETEFVHIDVDPSVGVFTETEEINKTTMVYDNPINDIVPGNYHGGYGGVINAGVNSPFFYGGRVLFPDGSNVRDNNGEIYNIKKNGTTSQMPTPTNIGFQYINTGIHMPLWWDGEMFMYGDGVRISAKRAGVTADRPTGSHTEYANPNDPTDISETQDATHTEAVRVGDLGAASQQGFVYFDTTLGKPVYAKEINGTTGVITWVDATGAPA